ncbi:NUDIX hydrolase [Pararhodobacter oceanensis]|uniref:DNA mismatch repair protein MutT n=1 Tax=Pararhodobacter oceanensis TaxID=2172121 RepID=A0A2T8HX44_9RHOB|nr:NUDIX hydrolase [Pararhodobacter oceanensis]PVH29991.1 DNA mismatch repair protein MutT [Pararhodobacter oceanensis]
MTAGDPDDHGFDRPIRDAATIVLIRDGDSDNPQVLMGQRGSAAAFMPSKYVFPGGAVDPDDGRIALTPAVPEIERARLLCDPVTAQPPSPEAMVAAAIRELWEEAGQMLCAPRAWGGEVPRDWADFAKAELCPRGDALQFMFRAVTPPGRSRRFDARFFLARAEMLATDPDDFSRATDELSHLHWIALREARGLDLPFVTEVVLAEAEAVVRSGRVESVPYFDNSGPESRFRRIA